MATDKLKKFEKIAERRVAEAIRRIKLVGNLSNRLTYNYTDQHVQQVIGALEAEIEELKNRFLTHTKTNKPFSFNFGKKEE